MPSLTSIFETARRALIAGSYDYAIALAEHVIAHFPKCVEGYSLLGRAYIEKGLPGKAEGVFELVLSVDPEDFAGHVGLGVARRDKGDNKGALEQFRRALDIQPKSSSIREEILRLHRTLGDGGGTTVKLTRIGLSRTYMNAGLYVKAIAELEAVLADNPHSLDAMVMLAKAKWLAGKSLDARQACLSILELSPDCLKPKLILADLYFSESLQETALALLRETQAIDPNSRIAKCLLAGRPVLGIMPQDLEIDLALPETQGTTVLT